MLLYMCFIYIIYVEQDKIQLFRTINIICVPSKSLGVDSIQPA